MKEELEAEHEKTLDSTRETLTREHEENLQTLRSELQKDFESKQSQLEEQKTLQLAIEEEASGRLEERKKQLKEEHETAQVGDIHVACDIHVIYIYTYMWGRRRSSGPPPPISFMQCMCTLCRYLHAH